MLTLSLPVIVNCRLSLTWTWGFRLFLAMGVPFSTPNPGSAQDLITQALSRLELMISVEAALLFLPREFLGLHYKSIANKGNRELSNKWYITLVIKEAAITMVHCVPVVICHPQSGS